MTDAGHRGPIGLRRAALGPIFSTGLLGATAALCRRPTLATVVH